MRSCSSPGGSRLSQGRRGCGPDEVKKRRVFFLPPVAAHREMRRSAGARSFWISISEPSEIHSSEFTLLSGDEPLKNYSFNYKAQTVRQTGE